MLVYELKNEVENSIKTIDYTKNELEIVNKFIDILNSKDNANLGKATNESEWDSIPNVNMDVIKELNLTYYSLDELEDMGEEGYKPLPWQDDGKVYTVYTDGACSGNPGPGGYGIVIRDEDGNTFEFSGDDEYTTNNKMELLAPIMALAMIPEGNNITLVSDSEYVLNPFLNDWITGWIKTNWKKGTLKNIDLWKKLIPLLNNRHVEFVWVKGHNKNEFNERCDEMAVAAYQKYKSNYFD